MGCTAKTVMNTLSTELSTFLGVFLLLVCAFAVVCAIHLRRLTNYCRDSVNYVLSQNKNSVSLRRMAAVEATMTDLTDSYDGLLASHKKLRSRIGMRATREKSQNGLDSTDDKVRLRLAAKQSGLLR